MRIGPHEMLAIGTPVKVGNRFGTVVKAEVVQAVPCGTIVVHTIHFTHKVVRGAGRIAKKVELHQEKTETVNYSFIDTQC